MRIRPMPPAATPSFRRRSPSRQARRRERGTRLATLLERDVLTLARTGVDLARAADLRLRILDHLFPVRDPAGQAAEREHHREHVRRDAHRAVDDAAVEVDVRVEL